MTKETIKLNRELVDHIICYVPQENREQFIDILSRLLTQVDEMIEERIQGHLIASHNETPYGITEE
jgi:hypothetical protein